MEDKFRNILGEPFKVCSHIEDYDVLLKYSISKAPESSLSKFLIRTKPMWQDYSREKWVEIIESVDNEIALLGLTIFFGRYLKVDLLETISKGQINIPKGYILYVNNYISTRKSLFYLDKKFEDNELSFYLNENEFLKVSSWLFDEGFVKTKDISPPETLII